eukprot:scaffold9268_cov31-Prasinocladus_malaysianus.AAC.1
MYASNMRHTAYASKQHAAGPIQRSRVAQARLSPSCLSCLYSRAQSFTCIPCRDGAHASRCNWRPVPLVATSNPSA